MILTCKENVYFGLLDLAKCTEYPGNGVKPSVMLKYELYTLRFDVGGEVGGGLLGRGVYLGVFEGLWE